MNTNELQALKNHIRQNFTTEAALTLQMAELTLEINTAKAALAVSEKLFNLTNPGKNETERKSLVFQATEAERGIVSSLEVKEVNLQAGLRIAQLERSMLSKLTQIEITLANHEPQAEETPPAEEEQTLGDFIVEPEIDESEPYEPSVYDGTYSEE